MATAATAVQNKMSSVSTATSAATASAAQSSAKSKTSSEPSATFIHDGNWQDGFIVDGNFHVRIIRNYSYAFDRKNKTFITVHYHPKGARIEDYLSINVPSFVDRNFENKVIKLLQMVLQTKINFLTEQFGEDANNVEVTVENVNLKENAIHYGFSVVNCFSIVAKLKKPTVTKELVAIVKLTDGYGVTILVAKVPNKLQIHRKYKYLGKEVVSDEIELASDEERERYTLSCLQKNLSKELEQIKKTQTKTTEEFELRIPDEDQMPDQQPAQFQYSQNDPLSQNNLKNKDLKHAEPSTGNLATKPSTAAAASAPLIFSATGGNLAASAAISAVVQSTNSAVEKGQTKGNKLISSSK